MDSNFTTPIPLTLAEQSSYGYIPTQWVAIVFLSLFGLSTALHIGQTIWSRLWWLFPTAITCGLLELIGWSGRLWSSINVLNDTAYLMQISTTIIAPTPLVAANFILLGRIIALLGPRYSRISARWYTRIFLTCDIIALVIQAAGGGIASGADDETGSALGGHIALAGIIFQLVAIICYTALAVEFLTRYVKDWPLRITAGAAERRVKTTRRMKLMLLGMAVMTVFIFIRSIYRTAELSDGWSGKIASTEWLFTIFDGLMIVFAMFTLNIFHPGRLLVPEETAAKQFGSTPASLSELNPLTSYIGKPVSMA